MYQKQTAFEQSRLISSSGTEPVRPFRNWATHQTKHQRIDHGESLTEQHYLAILPCTPATK